ncbi:MAG: hypothetical protein Kow0049_14690 [Stanieria sp.]
MLIHYTKLMPSIKLSSKTCLLTIISCGSTFVGSLSVQAATFSSAQNSLVLTNFSISPFNPTAQSDRNAVAISGDASAVVNSNADGIQNFVIDNRDINNPIAFLSTNFKTNATGKGLKYSGQATTFSEATANFSIAANQILSFDFQLTLDINNKIDSLLDGSIATFSGISFSLFDSTNEGFLGGVRILGNLTTNLAQGFNNDFLDPRATPNISITNFFIDNFFGNNQEFGQIILAGKYQNFFANPTQVQLVANTSNQSCIQAPKTINPCQKVPESDNTWALIFGFWGLGLFSRLIKRNRMVEA